MRFDSSLGGVTVGSPVVKISVQLRFNPPRGGFGTGTGNDTDSDTAGSDTGSDSASRASHPRPQDSHASHS
jgi:hypothetical protein